MNRIYRGGRLKDLRPETRRGVATGKEITVHHADLDGLRDAVESVGGRWGNIKFSLDGADETANEARIDTLDRLKQRGVYEGVETKHVVGGFSQSYGTSLRFASSAVSTVEDVPLVLRMDPTLMPRDPIAVEYTEGFKADHPHIAGYVDRGGEMLRVANGNVIYADVKTGSSSFYDAGTVKYRDDPLGRFNRLGDELEVVFYGEAVPIDNATVDVVATLTDTNISTLLAEEGAAADEDAAERLSDNDRHESTHEIIAQHLGGLGTRLIVLETVVGVGTRGEDRIDPDKFIHAYDGAQHYENAATAPGLGSE